MRLSSFPRWWVFVLVVAVVESLPATQAAEPASREESLWQERTEATAPVLPRGYDPLPSLAGLVKQLRPAVVNIFTTQVVRSPKLSRPQSRDPFFEEFFGGADPFERFFGIPRGEFKTRSLGSGLIIRPDGYILTNHHVVAHATEIKIKLADEREYTAVIIGSDPKTDVALLKIQPRGKLPIAYLGDSEKLEVGDWVVAIGNPFGLGHTVTTGIISGKDRVIGHGPYDDFLQTDASINPGNSGGPLFDSAGNVVGINTAIVAQGSGIGFAVPINMAKEMLPQLHESGKVRRGWLGVGVQDLTAELADKFGGQNRSGVLVSQVFERSPADKAGIKAGDIILTVNGRQVNATRELSRRVAALAPGSRASIRILRSGRRWTVRVRLAEREAQEKGSGGQVQRQEGETFLGLTLAPMTARWARRLGVNEKLRGLVVEGVDQAGPTAGILKAGDIILEVNRTRVAKLADFRKVVEASGGPSVLMLVQRGSSQLFLVVNR